LGRALVCADTPEHHFRRIMCSLYSAKSMNDYDATWTYAISLTANNELDVRTLLLKYPDLIDQFKWLYAIPSFREHGFHPKALVEAQKTIWGVSH